jgi:uncharacterized protein YbjT (DUF2867 family)
MLVTGATGKVGSHFVPCLLQRENNVRLLIRRAEQVEAFQKVGAEVIVGDLSQPESLASAVAGSRSSFIRQPSSGGLTRSKPGRPMRMALWLCISINYQKIRLYNQKQFSRNRGKA